MSPFSGLPNETLYEILTLRCDVFVVEQKALFNEHDGRDHEPTAMHLWATGPGGELLSALRVLDEGEEKRIGRVVSAPTARGLGIARALMLEAITYCGARPIVLHVQEHLRKWYGAFGFVPCSEVHPPKVGCIPHIDMRRDPQ